MFEEQNLTISYESKGYENVVGEISDNLAEHSNSSLHLTVREILEDEQLEISREKFEGDRVFEPLNKYVVDEAAVFTFRGPEGFYLAGNKAIIDMSLPDPIPSIY